MNAEKTQNNDWVIIDTYTRKQAFEDGFLCDLSTLCPETCRAFKYPVACTDKVYNLIQGANFGGWVWDLCYMATKSPHFKMLTECKKLFSVILPRKAGSAQTKEYKLICDCGPGDDAEPVITFMFPDED